MRLVRSSKQMAEMSARLQRQGRRIGLVPTMGALHEGHLSLIRRAAKENDTVIVTIFVNPLQFGPREDYARYPRPLSRDVRLARDAGADVIFAPSVAHLYPPVFQTTIDPGAIGNCWEGKRRPGHFRGVATVVTLLFHLTRPTRAYFGQKDYQQTVVIRRLVEDLQIPVSLRICPTVRAPDGLALSSRNASLNTVERRDARVLFQSLSHARSRVRAGVRDAGLLLREVRRIIARAPHARVDDVAIVDPETLQPIRRLQGRVVILLAVWIGQTRLIDNLLVDVP